MYVLFSLSFSLQMILSLILQTTAIDESLTLDVSCDLCTTLVDLVYENIANPDNILPVEDFVA